MPMDSPIQGLSATTNVLVLLCGILEFLWVLLPLSKLLLVTFHKQTSGYSARKYTFQKTRLVHFL